MTSANRKRHVLLLGRHELGCRVLDVLLGQSAVELAVVPARCEDAGRRPALAQAAARKSIKVYAGDKSALANAVADFKPQVLISAGYDRIIPATLLARVPHCFNVHFGMLPRYRGSYSIPWAILNDEPELGITLHEIAPGIDDGPIVCQEHFANDPNLSCRDLYERAVGLGSEMVSWLIAQVLAGNPPRATAQDERLATYHPPGYPNAFRIPWRQTATYATNYIRATHFPPYEGAFGEIDRLRVVFDWPVTALFGRPDAAPGTVVQSFTAPAIATLNGVIIPGTVSIDQTPMSFGEVVARHSLLNRAFA